MGETFDIERLTELPLDGQNILFFMSKKGLDFSKHMEIMRILENSGADAVVCTSPKGIIENEMMPIIPDYSPEEIDAEKFLALVVCATTNGEFLEKNKNSLKELIKKFHDKNKTIIFIGNSRSILFDMKIETINQAGEIEKGIFKINNIFFIKNEDYTSFADVLKEHLSKKIRHMVI